MKVLIVDDEAPARERLRELLNRLPDHEPCGEASHGAEGGYVRFVSRLGLGYQFLHDHVDHGARAEGEG